MSCKFFVLLFLFYLGLDEISEYAIHPKLQIYTVAKKIKIITTLLTQTLKSIDKSIYLGRWATKRVIKVQSRDKKGLKTIHVLFAKKPRKLIID